MKFNKKNKRLIIIGSVILLVIVVVGLWAGLRVKTRLIPNGNVSLSSTYSKYIVGEDISVNINNDFNSTIYFDNNCPDEPLDVYRLENTTWVRIHAKADENKCQQNTNKEGIPPNEARDVSFAAWPDLFSEPGKYRVVAYVEYYDQLPFTDFEVIIKPKIPEIPKISTSNPASSSSSTNPSSNSGLTMPTTNSSSTPSNKSQTIKIAQGTVIVTYDNNAIYVQSITPASGYTYEGGRSGKEVEITFKSSSSEVKLELELKNGKIVQELE